MCRLSVADGLLYKSYYFSYGESPSVGKVVLYIARGPSGDNFCLTFLQEFLSLWNILGGAVRQLKVIFGSVIKRGEAWIHNVVDFFGDAKLLFITRWLFNDQKYSEHLSTKLTTITQIINKRLNFWCILERKYFVCI